jgi:hypothetical protein
MKRYTIDALEMVLKTSPNEPAEFTRGGQVVMTYSPIEGLHEIPASTFKQPIAACLIETIVSGDEAVAPVSKRHAANLRETMQHLANWDRARTA